jgi:putative Holliday junction resolvase
VRVLGLDIGERRVGVAISDSGARVATPHDVMDAHSVTGERALMDIVEEWDVGLVVIGIPVSLDGSEGSQATRIREVGDELAGRLPVPVVYHDERLTSAEAGRRMAEAGLSEKERRGKVDMVAAALILQSYLDTSANADGAAGSARDGGDSA